MSRHRIHLGDDVRELAFGFGDVVYLRCRDEPLRGMVTGLHVRQDQIAYAVSWGTGQETSHYEMELTSEFSPHFHGGGTGGGAAPEGEGS